MFGLPDDQLLANLEAMRRRVCAYGAGPDDRCDCKYGAAEKPYGENTGCPELRQAIAIISGQREQVTITKELLEESAVNTLRRLRQVLDAHDNASYTAGSQEPEATTSMVTNSQDDRRTNEP